MLKTATLIAVLTLQGCSRPEPDPLKDAIVAKVKEVNPGVASFTIMEITKEADVTLENELDRRTAVFESKMRAETKLVNKYRKAGMPVNEEKHLTRQRQTGYILIALEQYRNRHAAQMDSVLYSVMTFRGYGEMEDGSVVSDAVMMITVAPDLRIYNIVPQKDGNVYKGMGVAIPGYREMITQFREEDGD